MKKFGVLCLVLVMLLSVCTPLTYATSAVSPETSEPTGSESTNSNTQQTFISSTYGLDAPTSMLGADKLIDNLGSAFLFDVNSRTLMYAWNADEKMHPASLVKLLTALIAIDKGDLSEPVTATEDVLSSVPMEAMSADLLPGEVMKLEDLIHCMMAGSANDAAAVIAAHISGSQSAFVAEMNRYAAELGCTGSLFTNPHGLHDPDQYTTARDVARILDAALSREAFLPFFSAVHYTVPATNMSEARYLDSVNFLMNNDGMQIYYDERVTGGRTGETQDGKRCVAVSAEIDGMNLICIVMGAKSTYDEAGRNITVYGGFEEISALLDKGTGEFKIAQILYANQALEQKPVHGGANDVILGPMSDHTAVIPSNAQMRDITLRYLDSESFRAPISKGDKISTVEVYCGGMMITAADLYALNSVPVKTENTQQDQASEPSSLPTVLIIVLCVVGGCVLILILLRVIAYLRFAGANRRRKQYRRDRRRSR